MKHEISLTDIKVDDNNYEYDLLKLLGKKVKEIRGYFSGQFGDATFKLTDIVFEDGSKIGVEGEHDCPYVVDYRKYPQPNFDDETFARLMKEQESR